MSLTTASVNSAACAVLLALFAQSANADGGVSKTLAKIYSPEPSSAPSERLATLSDDQQSFPKSSLAAGNGTAATRAMELTSQGSALQEMLNQREFSLYSGASTSKSKPVPATPFYLNDVKLRTSRSSVMLRADFKFK